MLDWSMIAVLVTILGAVWTLAWWLSLQFTSVRSLVYDRIEKFQNVILTKLEYHERLDDKRFSDINDDLWNIRVRNATIDGGTPHLTRQDRERIKFDREEKDQVI